MLLEFLQERGDERDAQHEPEGDVHDEFTYLPEQFLAFKLVFDGDGGEQHHEHHCEEVFHDKDAEAYAGEAMAAQSCLFDGFEDDGGG